MLVSKNEEKNGIEITFNEKPSTDVIASLKGHGFRWSRFNKLWWAKETPERAEFVDSFDADEAVLRKAEEQKANKFGVKVGDMFSASWGYDQTNVDFFQVVALVGATSLRVRQVMPRMISEEPTCSMAAYRTYEITNELLPAMSRSVFIHDQEKGDLKRLKSYMSDGVSCPRFRLSSFADATLCTGSTERVYESWYA